MTLALRQLYILARVLRWPYFPEAWRGYETLDDRRAFTILGDSGSFLWSDFSRYVQEVLRIDETCFKEGIEIVHEGHVHFPTASLKEGAYCLFVQGDSKLLSSSMLAVVGSRELSDEIAEWMEKHLTRYLQLSQDIVLSGAARGTDQWAHRLALRTGLPTVAVLPSGLLNIYPREFQNWSKPVLEGGGLLVSSFLPQQSIRRYHFVERNRLLVQLSRSVFVAQARRQSGSMMTARMAQELNRPLLTLPVFPDNARANGNLDLLADGCILVRDYLDLLANYGITKLS